MTTFYCLRFEAPPTWIAMSPYLYRPGTGWPSYTPMHWVPFQSPFTTCRATVEIFEPELIASEFGLPLLGLEPITVCRLARSLVAIPTAPSLERLRKITNGLSECSLFSGRDSNRLPPEYERETLPLEPAC
jgi:hypothetical protein